MLPTKMFFLILLILGSIFVLDSVRINDFNVKNLKDIKLFNEKKTALASWKYVDRSQTYSNLEQQNMLDEEDDEILSSIKRKRRKCKRRKTITTTTITSRTTKKSDSDISYPVFFGHEDEDARLECNTTKGHKIRIIDAYYGVHNVSKCPPTKFGPVTKTTGQRKTAVEVLCGEWTQSQCLFPIKSSILGDSCKGLKKTLRVTYTCSLPEYYGL